MSELLIAVPFPQAVPTSGDTILYANVATDPTGAAQRPYVAGPVQSGEHKMNSITGWFQANQDGTVKVQSWDPVTGAWVTINNDGNGDAAPAAGGPADITAKIPAGRFKIVVNFAVAPTVWKTVKKWQLSQSS